MKKLLLACSILSAGLIAEAQPTINFINNTSCNVWQDFIVVMDLPARARWLIQADLWWGLALPVTMPVSSTAVRYRPATHGFTDV